MVLRYFDSNHDIDILLFNGSKKDTIKYIKSHWPLDATLSPRQKAEQLYDILHLQVSKVEFKQDDSYIPIEHLEWERRMNILGPMSWKSISPIARAKERDMIRITIHKESAL
jgi:hypothetical protein